MTPSGAPVGAWGDCGAVGRELPCNGVHNGLICESRKDVEQFQQVRVDVKSVRGEFGMSPDDLTFSQSKLLNAGTLP